ncbi:uncharacterized protein NEMAJ01_1224 [Nematocida major]|uniref:uncharacterized protein n=1 Tax=Nematocida major TaxID=1912982 RepID=UPI0020076437|nr:uncharacterized protein NEMAJ01_1224 [Nematocida major]KAH9386328.1 hypothetical protein NEMAJ01_1224 [Nematocida major]
MKWTVRTLSRKDSGVWAHIEEAPYLKITAVLQQDALRIYLKFFGHEELAETVPVPGITLHPQPKNCSVAICTDARKIQLKLPSDCALKDMHRTVLYAAEAKRLAAGLASITDSMRKARAPRAARKAKANHRHSHSRLH